VWTSDLDEYRINQNGRDLPITLLQMSGRVVEDDQCFRQRAIATADITVVPKAKYTG